MTTSKSKRCRGPALAADTSALLSLLFLLCAAGGAQARSDGMPGAAAPSVVVGAAATSLSLVPEERSPVTLDARDQELYLEVSVNRAQTGRLARFVIRDDVLYASAATLRALELRWAGSESLDGLVALREIPGMQVQYDPANQKIVLQVPVAMMESATTVVGFTQPGRPVVDPASRVPGAIFNYELYGQRGDDSGTLSGFNELRVFGVGRGVFGNTLSLRLSSGQAAQLGRHDSVRLDSYWQLDLPDRMTSVTVGDTVTGSLDWSRATRIAGVRVSRNFSLQPYRITTPLASFAGEAVLPSTVDLYIDGLRQSSQDVQPGRFQIDSAPSLSGVGQARMVINDINGQSRVVGFWLYGTPELLQAGLSDWSLELGVVRRDYGLRSFSYGSDPMFSATGRHGLSDWLTIEGHAEGSADLQQAGVGGAWLLGRAGVVSASLAGSRGQGIDGHQHGLGYQWSSRGFNASMSTLRRSAGFRDVGSLEDALLPRRTDQVFAGLSTDLGQWSVSYVAQTTSASGRSRFASINWSRLLARTSTLSLSVIRDLGDQDSDSAFLFWSLALDRFTSLSTTARHSRNSQGLTVEANRAIPGDLGGWGWRAQATLGDAPGGQVQVNQLGQYGQWSAGLDHFRRSGDPSTTAYASASGGLAWMQGQVYAMRRVDDAFTLVSTSGVADVPVRLENRIIGSTDEHGLLLVSRLNAWQRNQISIDTLQLPADMQVGKTELEAVPEGRSGVLTRFELRRTLSLQLGLRDSAGAWVAAGSAVWMDAPGMPAAASARTVVGHDGVVYLQDPPAGATLRIVAPHGSCAATLPALARTQGRIDIGELTCE